MRAFNHEIPVRHFFACIFFVASGLTLLLAGFIFMMDPYAIWRQQMDDKLIAIRPEISAASQPGAAILRSRLHTPDVLILGSSRVRRGFNEAFASHLYGGKVQVAGLDALPLSSAKELIFTISQQTHIKKFYLEINFLTSNACNAKNDNMTRYKLASPLQYFSPKDALLQSYTTLKINLLPRRSFDAYFDAQGRYHDDPSKGATRAGRMETYESRYNRMFQMVTSPCERNVENAADIKDLSDIFRLAQARQTEVILLALPVSPRWQIRMQEGGLSPQAAKWKKDMTSVASQFHVTVLDYEERGDLSPLAENSNDAMPTFWDETHFSNRLGDHILNNMRDTGHFSSISPIQ
ncbi:hypothetical protein P9875_27065 [Janthinobacterium rivuli]|uniref:DUF1574 domain-containing protein n=1 Tax=Janthinobacterium rivuli TaxID=2751478 RepID=A0ABY8I325_9BURK|nr:hypothetical protein [Janthinobacterium rivuli]WFR79304.1 hypothetical protein P9875_27065 [Janthinobacterium rivuli]